MSSIIGESAGIESHAKISRNSDVRRSLDDFTSSRPRELAEYLADNVLMLRYFEMDGEVHEAISVFKKRGSLHERSIRQFSMSEKGIEVGNVLKGFHGILTGVPHFASAVFTTTVLPTTL